MNGKLMEDVWVSGGWCVCSHRHVHGLGRSELMSQDMEGWASGQVKQMDRRSGQRIKGCWRGSCTSVHGVMNGQTGRAKVTPQVRTATMASPDIPAPRPAPMPQTGQQTLTFTCSCGDEAPGKAQGSCLQPAQGGWGQCHRSGLGWCGDLGCPWHWGQGPGLA